MQTPAGAACHLLERLPARFELLYVADGAAPALPPDIGLTVIGRDLIDVRGDFGSRFDAAPGTAYLLAARSAYLRTLAQADAGQDRGRPRPCARAQAGVRSACAVT